MKRILTGIVGTAVALVAIFAVTENWFFILCSSLFLWAAIEFQRICRFWAPKVPGWPLMLAIPVLAFLLSWSGAEPGVSILRAQFGLTFLGALVLGSCLVVLFGRVPVPESLPAIGVLIFGTLYFAIPLASIVLLRRMGPWLLFLTAAIIWVGDAVALYAGKAFGKRKIAPVVSPNKTWAGTVASLLAALVVTSAWSWWRLGAVDPILLAVGLATSCAGQLGDLVESMIKRGAGVKDSGHLLPGHGGMYDRLDALLFGAPVMWLGQYLLF